MLRSSFKALIVAVSTEKYFIKSNIHIQFNDYKIPSLKNNFFYLTIAKSVFNTLFLQI